MEQKKKEGKFKRIGTLHFFHNQMRKFVVGMTKFNLQAIHVFHHIHVIYRCLFIYGALFRPFHSKVLLYEVLFFTTLCTWLSYNPNPFKILNEPKLTSTQQQSRVMDDDG
jgi:hypothetical protein